jgi:hypothetical protein
MSDKPKRQAPDSGKEAPQAPSKAEQKTSETVHLSAEELRKISGGATGVPPPPPGTQHGH